MEHDPRIAEPVSPRPLPRWVTIPAGILLLPIVILCGAGSAFLLFDPRGKNVVLTMAIATGMLLLTCWLGLKVFQLIFNVEQKSGGLLSPFALRAVAVVFLLLPVGGSFTGYFLQRPVIALVQTLACVSIFFGLHRLAAFREAKQQSSVGD